MKPEPALEGLTRDFLDSRIHRLLDEILPATDAYYEEGGTPYTQNHPSLKKNEMLSRYYDYQACTISALSVLAERGNERALEVIRRIFRNARTWLEEGRTREGHFVTFRRSQLHMVLACERLEAHIESEEAASWRDLLLRTGQDVFDHFDGFQETSPQLDNRGFRTGINHVALAAESIWRSGHVLMRPDWQEAAAGFVDRLLAYGHEDGYFEENTNDAREGGPSILYTPLTSGSLFHVQRWRGAADRGKFEKIGALYRQFTDTHLHPMPFADERANPHAVGPYGLALHSLSPEGRGFLRLLLDDVDMSDHVSGDRYLQHMSRAVYEMQGMDTGEGAIPEPFTDGLFRLTLPLGVIRKGPWTAGLSGMKALNREISAHSDYAIDRQSLFALSHREVGYILEGAKSKHDTNWSSVRSGDDAYPVSTGELTFTDHGARARVLYAGFDIEAEWELGTAACLRLSTHSDAELVVQLPLEIAPGRSLTLNGEEQIVWPGEEMSRTEVTTVAAEGWQVRADSAGALTGPILPHNPYTDQNRSDRRFGRLMLAIPWRHSVSLTFSVADRPCA